MKSSEKGFVPPSSVQSMKSDSWWNILKMKEASSSKTSVRNFQYHDIILW
jgi:hypothetical protein